MTIRLPDARERWRVVQADSLQWLPRLPDASIDAVVCDPPYGIDFQGQAWDGSTIRKTARAATNATRLSDGQAFGRWTTLWASELARALRPGGHLVAFAAPRMAHRLTSGLEDAGLEIRDTLMWLHGTGMPKSRRLPGGRGTALKPAHEPIILARRPPDTTITETIRQHGTGALNTEACANRVHHDCEGSTHTTSGAARWPANVLLTHAHGCRPGRRANGCPARMLETQHPGASRFLYCSKASRRERDAGCEQLPGQHLDLFPQAKGPHDPQARRVRNAHPTVKPLELMRWLVRLITPSDGLVLDPFCGSGSTGCAAVLEQRRFLGVELDPQHLTVARARITHWATDGHHAPRACQGRERRRPPRAGRPAPA